MNSSEFNNQSRGFLNKPKEALSASILVLQAGVHATLRQVLAAKKVAVPLDSDSFVIPYSVTGESGHIFEVVLRTESASHYDRALAAIADAEDKDVKILLEMEDDVSFIFYLLDTFPIDVLNKADLRCQVLRFFAHSEFSTYAAEEDQALTSSWWYIYCRLVLSLQKLINAENQSTELLDVRDQRILLEDSLACWIGKMQAAHTNFSFASLDSSHAMIDQADSAKIADASQFVKNNWKRLIARYSMVARESEIIDITYNQSDLGPFVDDPEYVDEFLQSNEEARAREEAIDRCENAFEPKTPEQQKQWDFPAKSIADLVGPQHNRVIIHGVFSAQSKQEKEYSNACAVQLHTCRLLAQKGFKDLVMQMTESDLDVLDKFLERTGKDVLRLGTLVYLREFLNNGEGDEDLGLVHTQSQAEYQLVLFMNHLALLKKICPDFCCAMTENSLQARLERRPNPKRPTIYITEDEITSNAKIETAVRILHQYAVSKIDTQEKVAAHDVVGYACHQLATKKSFGWGEHNTSLVQGQGNYFVEECLANSDNPTLQDVHHWLTQGTAVNDVDVIVDGIIVTGRNETKDVERGVPPLDVTSHSPTSPLILV